MADLGYDVADYKVIDPLFGTMNDFKGLIEGIHARGMKLLLDMVPNHVSDESEWFIKSENKEEPYTDFFMWHDAKGFDTTANKPIVPNNWLSLFGGSAWNWSDKRQQFYYTKFSKKQPDLNFRNQKVREAMKDVLRFWLDLGVDGFRLDAVKHLFEAEHLKDEPFASPDDEKDQNYLKQKHIYTNDLEENYEVTHEWRMLTEEYKENDNKTRILCSEAYSKKNVLWRYFGNETYKNVHFPFNFDFVFVGSPVAEYFLDFQFEKMNALFFNMLTHSFIDGMPAHGVANWQISNHDASRAASRTNPNFVDSMNMLALLLPGVVSVYYGDEIGMESTPIRPDQSADQNNNGGGGKFDKRDAFRAPMQWDDTSNAGFTTKSKPWLPVNPDYWFKNVKSQSENPRSHLNVFMRLMELRKSPVIRDGQLETCVLSEWVFMYVRKLESDGSSIVVIVNVGSESEEICAKNCKNYLPDFMFVHTGSINSGFSPGDTFIVAHSDKSSCSVLRPRAGVVLTENSQSSANRSASLSILLLITFSLSAVLMTM